MTTHAIQRIRERFNVSISAQELDWLVASTVSDQRNYVRDGAGGAGIWCGEYEGRVMFLVVRDGICVTVLRLSDLQESSRVRKQWHKSKPSRRTERGRRRVRRMREWEGCGAL